MDAELFINALFVAGFVAYVGIELKHRRKVTRMFEAAVARLGMGEFTCTQSNLVGRARGHLIEARFHAATKQTPQRTTIEVTARESAVILHLRKQDADEARAVQRGQAMDLNVGDPAFDAAWIVEAAPGARVRRMLSDVSLRAGLVAFSAMKNPTVSVEDGKVTLSFEGTEVGADQIATERMDLALALAEAVTRDARMPEVNAGVDLAAGSYRTVRRLDPRAAELAEIAALEAVRATRALGDLRLFTILTTTILAAIVGGVQLTRAIPPLAITLPVLLAAAAVSFGVLANLKKWRARAPAVPIAGWVVRWMIGYWVLNLAFLAHAIAVSRF